MATIAKQRIFCQCFGPMNGEAEAAHARIHPTLEDVARIADVSTSTVSRALRGSPLVRAGTRERVQQAAERLGYQPNRLARSLRLAASGLVGVVVPDIGIGFYARLVKSAQDALEDAGYQVLVMNTEREPEQERAALRTLIAHRVDGVLVAASGGFDGNAPVPIVFFDNLMPGSGVANVALANREGIALLVDHLVDVHGHERLGFVGGPALLTSGIERLDGFRAAIARHGLAVAPELVVLGDEHWSPRSGKEAAARLLALEHRPTAIVAAGDTLAFGSLEALREAGLRAPDDVALACFDDPLFADFLDPPLTALARVERSLGELAAQLLLETIAGKRGDAVEVRLPVELVVRRSCGCGSG
jgi:DNA-binding LacI/PurR family transcriptional regulator